MCLKSDLNTYFTLTLIYSANMIAILANFQNKIQTRLDVKVVLLCRQEWKWKNEDFWLW